MSKQNLTTPRMLKLTSQIWDKRNFRKSNAKCFGDVKEDGSEKRNGWKTSSWNFSKLLQKRELNYKFIWFFASSRMVEILFYPLRSLWRWRTKFFAAVLETGLKFPLSEFHFQVHKFKGCRKFNKSASGIFCRIYRNTSFQINEGKSIAICEKKRKNLFCLNLPNQ